MLVLTRKNGESIHIGGDIVVTVVDVSGGVVRLGIDAPSSVTILRAEVKKQIEEENRRAALSSGTSPDLSPLSRGLKKSRRL